jgi:hypothetical protein
MPFSPSSCCSLLLRPICPLQHAVPKQSLSQIVGRNDTTRQISQSCETRCDTESCLQFLCQNTAMLLYCCIQKYGQQNKIIAQQQVPWCQQLLASYAETGDRLCGLVVRVLGYRSGGPGSIPITTRKKRKKWSGSGTESNWVQLRSYLIEK